MLKGLKACSHGVTTIVTAIDMSNRLHCCRWSCSHNTTITTNSSQDGFNGYQ